MAVLSDVQEVSRWIEHNVSTADPAWAMSKAIKKKVQMPAPSLEFEGKKSKFLSFVDGYFKRPADVRAEAEVMREKYLNNKGPLGYRNRVFTKYACRVEFLTELIPNGEYTSPICGGLKLIISAARRHRNLVDVVLASLDALSEEAEGTATYIPGGSFKTGLRFIVNGEDYGATLQAKITSNIQGKSKAFDRAIQACFHQKTEAMAQNIVMIGKTLDHFSTTYAVDAHKREEEARRFWANCENGFKAVQSIEDHLHGIIKDLRGRVDQLEQRNTQYLLIQQSQHNNFFLSSPQPKVSDGQLLSALGFGSAAEAQHRALDAVQREIEFVSFVGHSLGHYQQGRISFVMENPAFREWFRSTTSNVLVVRGMDFNATQSDVVSTLSYMCAMLAKTVSQVQSVQPALFFCRLHSDPDGTLAGPRGMLSSLVSQLALSLAGRLDLGFLGADDLSRIQGRRLEDLWMLFEVIVNGLGPGFVFCMIDGVEFFESKINSRDMHQVMHWMSSFAADKERQPGGLVFKLLVTSPMGSEHLRQWYPGAVEVTLPGNYLGDGHGFNELRMMTSTQEMLL
ncbi:hypothetical protein CPLU01_14023 [Colletotrichum plurivorum]|uniref:Uncharacterized protein n=1 Tax=Colletotrichum plurivorum TaxID=2175906 RepID=A0A8H6JNJ6_9PEZI|nr:hypothetical protein CPLU01_14023 [Colletotrichum plurivorum]